MHQRSIWLVIFLLVMTLSTTVWGDSTQPLGPEMQNLEPDQREALLVRQLEMGERYQDGLITTIGWVVGTSFAIVLTITAVIVGLGWYTNFRIYRGDLEQIREQQERIYSENVKSLKEELKAEIEQKITAGLKKAKAEATTSAASSVQSAISEIRDLQLKMMFMEAKEWEEKDVDANALRTLSLAMTLAVEIGSQFEVSQVAEEVERVLQKGRAIMDGTLAQDLIDSLSVIKDSSPVLFESLSTRIRREVGL